MKQNNAAVSKSAGKKLSGTQGLVSISVLTAGDVVHTNLAPFGNININSMSINIGTDAISLQRSISTFDATSPACPSLCLLTLQLITCLCMMVSSAAILTGFCPFSFSCLMANFLQDALQALDDEELERFIRWLNMENFESSTSGGKLRELTNKAQVAGNASMPATTAVDLVSITTILPNSPGT